jgi:hypothetical protein
MGRRVRLSALIVGLLVGGLLLMHALTTSHASMGTDEASRPGAGHADVEHEDDAAASVVTGLCVFVLTAGLSSRSLASWSTWVRHRDSLCRMWYRSSR